MAEVQTSHWHAALTADNAEDAKPLWSAECQRDTDVRMIGFLSEALAFSPTPIRVLKMIADGGELPNDWIIRVGNVDPTIDWAVILSVLHEQNQEWIQKSELDALENGLDQLVNDGKREHLVPTLNALLNRNPKSATKFTDIADAETWAILAMDSSGGSWLAQSGLDIEAVLYEGLRAGLHHGWWMADTEAGSLAKMKEWRGRAPSFDQAWVAIEKDDIRRAQNFQDWMTLWLNDGQWHGSLLESWSGTAIARKGWEGPTPLDHPAFSQPWPTSELTKGALLGWASDFKSSLGVGTGLMLDEAAEWVCRYGLLQTDPAARWMLATSPNPFAQAFNQKPDWLDALAKTEEGATRIQSLIENDWRAARSFGKWDIKKVAGWLLFGEGWTTWRDRQGNNLLGRLIQEVDRAEGNVRTRTKSKQLAKRRVLEIAKRHPEILLEKNTNGVCVMDGLTLRDDHRAEIMRLLIGRHVEAKPKPTPSARMKM